ncbi:LPXTG cell wall anchor domain-containing protein [Saccharothrix texasensis]|nr:LPXTG cell wall anchor domain-containing protein [Saccharothrix texasensis]
MPPEGVPPLADTGPSTPLGLLTSVGALLLALGAALVGVGRQRARLSK